MAGFFYERLEDGTADGALYRPTEATQGPWSAEMQHGGPPSALALREIEALAPAQGGHIARITVDLLAPVPIAPLAVHTEVAKPGRRAQLITAEVRAGGRTVLTARAWWRRQVPDLVPEVADRSAEPLPEPGTLEARQPDDELSRLLDRGWVHAMEFRYVSGGFSEPGPCRVWVRPRLPLIENELTSPTQRAVLIADGSSGVSSALDFRTHLFSNLDLTVGLLRVPEGPWTGLDAVSLLDADGGGSTVTRLHDARGVCGHVMQSLYVEPHGAGAA